MTAAHKHIRTTTLNVAFEESGSADGVPIFLMHGWPYDPRCYDEVVPLLAGSGCAVMKKLEITLKVALGLGKASDRALTCGLTKEYIAINGDYRS